MGDLSPAERQSMFKARRWLAKDRALSVKSRPEFALLWDVTQIADHLLAERDALAAENERLRGVLTAARRDAGLLAIAIDAEARWTDLKRLSDQLAAAIHPQEVPE